MNWRHWFIHWLIGDNLLIMSLINRWYFSSFSDHSLIISINLFSNRTIILFIVSFRDWWGIMLFIDYFEHKSVIMYINSFSDQWRIVFVFYFSDKKMFIDLTVKDYWSCFSVTISHSKFFDSISDIVFAPFCDWSVIMMFIFYLSNESLIMFINLFNDWITLFFASYSDQLWKWLAIHLLIDIHWSFQWSVSDNVTVIVSSLY